MTKESEINITPKGDAIGIVIGDNNNLEGVFATTDGDVANVANQAPDISVASVSSERIKSLLARLHQEIESQQELNPTDKANALEQIKSLASLSSVDFIPFVEHEADISTPEQE